MKHTEENLISKRWIDRGDNWFKFTASLDNPLKETWGISGQMADCGMAMPMASTDRSVPRNYFGTY
jgi:hypothetical protein